MDKKLTDRLADKELKLITKVRKNMKKKMLTALKNFSYISEVSLKLLSTNSNP